MRALILATILVSGTAFLSGTAHAKRAMTLQEALSDAEKALDNGSVGDAIAISERLQKTHGLTKDEHARVEVIIARCKLIEGQFDTSEKLFAKHLKDDPRVNEWYARALDGSGKSDAALALLKDLAQKDQIAEGDSYWTLAQLERKKGDNSAAYTHAKMALEKPIVLQSDELDQAIHKFIADLTPKSK